MRSEEEIRRRILKLKQRELVLIDTGIQVGNKKEWDVLRSRKTVLAATRDEREVLEWVLEDTDQNPAPTVREKFAQWLSGEKR